MVDRYAITLNGAREEKEEEKIKEIEEKEGIIIFNLMILRMKEI